MSNSTLSELKARASALLAGSLKHVAAAGLAATLVPLGAVGTSQASAVTAFTGPYVTGSVDTIYSDEGSGSPIGLKYSYTVVNPYIEEFSVTSSGDVTGWALPLFQEVDLSDITTPDGWTYELDNGSLWDLFYNPSYDPKGDYAGTPASEFVNPVATLIFLASQGDGENGVVPGDSLGGFTFMVNLDKTPSDSPVVMMLGENTIIGDPPNPTAPTRGGGGNAVPEPITGGLLALAAAAGAGYLTSRRRA